MKTKTFISAFTMEKILYISALSSERLISDIYDKTGANPGYAIQKFSRLVLSGLIANGVTVTALSTPPVNKQYINKLWIKFLREVSNGISIVYVPILNIPILRHLFVFIYSFFYVLFWGIKDKDNKSIICDVLCVSSCMGALFASKIIGIRSVAVVTDIYNQMVGNTKIGIWKLLTRLAGFLNQLYVGWFTHYVLLTKAMNELVNPKQRPYIVMEAICDSSQIVKDSCNSTKSYPRVVIYAGGIEERYGLKMLVDAFKILNRNDIQLHVYGSGSYVEQLVTEANCNSSIVYKGVRPNEEILEAEKRASLLVNPRFTSEEFAKYSFPSKNMEYMVSGTPVLTTKLPGMPAEYYDYVFLFDEETASGFAHKISEIFDFDQSKLELLGENARRFVFEHKNNIKQAQRIINLLMQ